jgi:sugar (pentulose or hexulose) kinase
MATQSDLYLVKAEEFEKKARATSDTETAAAYAELAQNYRQLASRLQASSYGKPRQTMKN